jgi:FKBP-type peptidyl-prolyl cis-trans isomerase SlyD
MADLKVEKHKVLSFTYSILDENGVAQEHNDLAMSYVHGVDERVFPGVIAAMEGARTGETREVTMSPEQCFGEYDINKTFCDKIENIPPEFLKVGSEASFQNESGEQLTMTVKSVENGEIFLDGNHLFAGKTMTFKITARDIREATPEEIGTGFAVDNLAAAPKMH